MDTGLQGLELRHLVALVAVADTGTFSRAAEQLGYTQSAVSQQIAALERVAGTPLFDRPGGPRPVQPTQAGAVLTEHARAVLARLRGAAADVASVAAGESGRLRVGTVQSVGTHVLPGLLQRLGIERPGIEIVLQESNDPDELLALVAEGELDITFCHDPVPDEPFAHRAVLDDPFVLLAPADSAEAARRSVRLDEIGALPLIGNRSPTCLGMSIERLMPVGASPHYVFHSDDNSTIQGCVGAGIGYSFAPLLTIDLEDPATTVVAVEPAAPPRVIALAWHAARLPSPAATSFIDATVEVCAEVARGWDDVLAVTAA